MKKLVLAMAVMLVGGSTFAQNTMSHLNHYIQIKTALVNGDAKTANTAIGAFYESLKDDGDFAQKATLIKAAEKLSKTGGNLEKQRAAFNDVSTMMWAFVKDSDKVNQSVYYQYCPMKKSYWLSKEEEIKNPYYGSSMLTCGKVVETKK